MKDFFLSNRAILLFLLRLICGGIFVFSAIAKLIDLDAFELYIYSQNLCGFDIAGMMARLFISIELALGIFLISGNHTRTSAKVSLYLLLFFSLFLVLKLIKDAGENCHCFGSLWVMNPGISLFKNFGVIALILMLIKIDTVTKPSSTLITTGIVCFSLALPPIISPPDFIYRLAHPETTLYKSPEKLHLPATHLGIDEDKKAVVFLSTSCKYCLLAAQKISVIAGRTRTHEHIVYVFAGGEDKLESFWEKSHSLRFNYTVCEAAEVGKITQGHLPLVLFTDKGVIISKSTYRGLSESLFNDFF